MIKKVLWLYVASHVTSFSLLECFISALHSYKYSQIRLWRQVLPVWFYLVDHGHDGNWEVDLEAVCDGHADAAEEWEDQTPF